MSKRFAWIGCVLAAVLCVWTGCKDDVTTTGQSVLDADDAIIVLTDTFGIRSSIDSCQAIAAQADSFLLGDPVTYTADIKISNTKLEDGYANLMYRFTDIYNQIYWSEAILY